ncbi:uncharacterized protein [Bombus fervidus]|uniref:uncharacterized protein n=1 Tax=Bombus fervidus TaxID=203811 RepID=UPI003D18D463
MKSFYLFILVVLLVDPIRTLSIAHGEDRLSIIRDDQIVEGKAIRVKRAPVHHLPLLAGTALVGKKALLLGGAAVGAKALLGAGVVGAGVAGAGLAGAGLAGAGLYKTKYYSGGYGGGYSSYYYTPYSYGPSWK